MRRSFAVLLALGLLLVSTPLLAATARELVPSSAPHGARSVIAGSALDTGTIAVTFAASGGGTVAAPILSRAQQFVELSVPATAVTGSVHVAINGSEVASFNFTLLPDPAFVSVTTLGASVQAHDLFKDASGVAVASSTGTIYVTDTLHHQVKVLAPDGRLLSVIGSGNPGLVDGSSATAKFKQPGAAAIDALGNVYVADTGNHVIRKIASDGTATTFAGSGLTGDADGPALQARFKQPMGLAFDASGNLLVADTGNNRIRLITPAGTVTTVAGGVHDGFADGAAGQALFKQPSGVVVSPSGVIFVADAGNNRIRKMEAGQVSTVAGTGLPGFNDGSPITAQFNQPSAITLDDAGNVLVADTGNHAIRKVTITPSGTSVTTVSGNGSLGYVDGAPTTARFKQPKGIDFKGALFVADSGNDALRVIYSSVTLSALYPRSGSPSGGTVVRIFGIGFVPGATRVTFGDVPATNVTFVAASEILATAPAHAAGTVDVAVTTPAGTATLTNSFTYLPPPTLSSIEPRKGKTAGGETVTLFGTTFVGDETTVTIGGTPAQSVSVISPSSISATTPPGSAGPADVTVSTPGGSATLAAGFTYFAPPAITAFSPASGRAGDAVTITGSNFDPETNGNRVSVGGVTAAVSSATATTLAITVPQNAQSGPISVTTAGGTATSSTAFTVITYVSLAISPTSVTLNPGQTLQLTTTATLAGGGMADVTSQAVWSTANASVATVTTGLVRAIAAGSTTVLATLQGLQASVPVTVRNPEPVPPDPSTVASKIDPTIVGMFVDEIKFLYTGTNPIQTGVAAGAIDDNRAAVIRGTVRTRTGQPLPAVKVSAAGHSELGQTLTRADGVFDFVINGGGTLALQFAKNNFITAQRSVTTTWGAQTTIDDIVLVGYDAQVTEITLGAPAEQVARGSVVSDADGSRRATLLVPPGTTALLVLPNGTTQAVSTLHVRATEFTVGPNGPKAMPAALPPASGYTYCVELSADEAVAAAATDVRFSKPLPFYAENFLGFAVGTVVPAGYYDRSRATWVPSDNGVVLKVVAVTGSLADIDLNGDGAPETASALAGIGIDDAERQTLATLYAPGQTLWRVPVAHFTPWDPNWPRLPQEVAPGDAVAPNQPQPYWIPAPSKQDSCGDVPNASTVNCYSATLSESIPIVGTPFTLEYESSRVAPTQNSTTISLSGATVPASLKRIDLAITIAGSKQTFSFAPQANLKHEFTWSGVDVFGRRIQGAREAGIVVSYVYDSIYARPAPSGRAWDRMSFQPTGVPGRTEMSFSQAFTVRLGHFDIATAGFGTWVLSAQHFYDGRGGAIYDAGGTQRSGDPNQTKQLALTTYAGNMTFRFSGDGAAALQAGINAPNFLAVGPDGALYLCDSPTGGGCTRIRKVDPNTHIINTIAGNGVSGFTADGAFALGNPISARHLAAGPDNTLYFLDGFRVRRIVDGLLTTVAGNGSSSPFGTPPDGSIATQVPMTPRALAVGRDGSVYIALSQVIIRVSPDGRTSSLGSVSNSVTDLAVGPEGDLYVADNTFVYRLGRDGGKVIGGASGFTPLVDGQLATSGFMSAPTMLAVAPDGTVLVSEVGGSQPRIRAIDTKGIATTLIGNGKFPNFAAPPEGAFARSTPIGPWGVAVGPDGSVFIIDQQLGLVRRAAGVFPPIRRGATVVPSSDGSAAYVFDNSRHTSTVDTLTGTTLLTLAYDSNGFLTTLTDLDGNVTTIERLSDGSLAAIVAPGGQRTSLQMTGGHLTRVANPAGETVTMEYDSAALLSDFRDARTGLHRFTYDAKGLVTRDDAPDGSSIVLSRIGLGQNYTVTRTTAEGRVHTYEVALAGNNAATREHDAPDGTALKMTFNGASTTTQTADGSVVTALDTPDPRFGMASPFTGAITLNAGGQQATMTSSRTVTRDPINPLALASLTQRFSLNGRQWSNAYDGSTRRTTMTTPAGRTMTSLLDAKGRFSSAALPGTAPISFAYGDFGLLATIAQGTRNTSFSYDAKHRLATITDPLQRTVRFEYDNADRVTTQTLPDGRIVTFTYDANGNVTSVAPPSRPQHLFTFTPADLTSSYTPPSSSATRYTYNRDRQLISFLRPDGSSVVPGYDTFGRLSAVAIGRGTYSYTYNAMTGRVRSITAPGGISLAYGYAGPLLTSITWSGPVSGAVAFAYDSNFRLASESVAGSNSIAFTYDADGLLNSSGVLTLQRNPQNGFLTGTMMGSIGDAFTYNEFGEPLGYAASSSGSAVFAEEMIRDDAGRISRKIETVAGSSHAFAYSYDTAGRLTDVIRDGSMTTSYRYDANSNRQQMLVNGSAVATGSYDDQDRLLTYGDAAYTYTAAGELATRTDSSGTTAYVYDELGNLTKVTVPGGTTIEYVTDGQNRRIGKRINGTLVQGLLYADQLRVIAELDGAGNVVSRFVYATRSNVPDYMIRSGIAYRIVSDHLGSPRLVVDTSTGAVVQQIDYDELGNVFTDTNSGFQPFGFAGGLYDPATRLLRFGARDYDPHTGRWTAKDPVGFAGGSANLYGYTFNDPINNIDPSGLVTVPGVGWVDVGENAGTEALAGYVDTLTDPNAAWYEKAGAAVGGAFSALWTPETSDATVTTLSCAYGGPGVAARRPYWRYVGPKSGPNGKWLTRGWRPPYGTNYSRAKDALQLPNTPTGVVRVRPGTFEPVAGPRAVGGNPSLGAGGGTEYYRGIGFP